ncbi:MAG: DUF3343 domain-containing protein [Coriobacteriia bacterium]|nr:DUF3343 domain-containing protein [Coriobacteriia bacterium]
MSTASPRHFRVLTFASTHDALSAEALLDDLGFDVVPVPAPPSLSANCGIALRVELSDADRASVYLERAGIEVERATDFEDF